MPWQHSPNPSSEFWSRNRNGGGSCSKDVKPKAVVASRSPEFCLPFLSALIALLAGAANPFQSSTNAQLNKELQHPVWAGIAVYAVGLAGMLLVQAIVREALPVGEAQRTSWWAWTGGIISIASTLAGLLLAQKLGSGLFTGLSLTASVVTSVLLDQFGVLGMKQHTASPGRLAGCALLIAGIWLVAKF